MKLLTDEECCFIKTRHCDGQGEIALMPMMFTVGLCCHISRNPLDVPYAYRYCYPSYSEALRAFETWDGQGHPSGNWIKQKGAGIDLVNPNFEGDL